MKKYFVKNKGNSQTELHSYLKDYSPDLVRYKKDHVRNDGSRYQNFSPRPYSLFSVIFLNISHVSEKFNHLVQGLYCCVVQLYLFSHNCACIGEELSKKPLPKDFLKSSLPDLIIRTMNLLTSKVNWFAGTTLCLYFNLYLIKRTANAQQYIVAGRTYPTEAMRNDTCPIFLLNPSRARQTGNIKLSNSSKI